MEYYKLYKQLFNNEKYKNLSINAKVTYSILASILNEDSIDNKEQSYIKNSRKIIQDILGLSINTISKIYSDLAVYKLIQEENLGFGKSNITYIYELEKNDISIDKNIELKSEVSNIKKCENVDLQVKSQILIKEITKDDVEIAKMIRDKLIVGIPPLFSNFICREKLKVDILSKYEKELTLIVISLMMYSELYRSENILNITEEKFKIALTNCKSKPRTRIEVYKILIKEIERVL